MKAMTSLVAILAGALLLPAIASAQTAALDSAACGGMAGALKLTNARMTAAQILPAGSFTPPAASGFPPPREIADLPAFCRVELTLTPSADSDIKAEVWLPVAGWNGKLVQVGNGNYGGSIQYGPMAAALKRGFATASTDTGHAGPDARFALGHPEKLKDWGYRSVHETVVQAKAIIAHAYRKPAAFAYFTGCSGGGRQAFAEVQRFPADFDGILAGASPWDRANESVSYLMRWFATHDKPESMIPPGKYPAIHRAALDACDAQDGLKDGLISDPPRCRFDPKAIECTSGETNACLTPAQVEAARKIYAPVKNPKTGEMIYPGLEPGSELDWANASGGNAPSFMGPDLVQYMLFQDGNWDYRTLDLARDYEKIRKLDTSDISPTSADLKPFAARGGRLIIYHGWADANVSPRSSVDYYDRLVKTMGQKQVNEAVRLYFAPGMAHCSGGEGPNVFDGLGALDEWRARGKAPLEIVASHVTDGKVDRTRPLCPYPLVAKHKGSGSIDQAENFTCETP